MTWRLHVVFEPRDCWVGIYWDRWRGTFSHGWDVYLCIVPCLPIHLFLNREHA
jgi:hypothetical protein